MSILFYKTPLYRSMLIDRNSDPALESVSISEPDSYKI